YCVVVHRRRAAEIGEVDLVGLRDLEKKAAGTAGPLQVVEADAEEFAEGDGQQREVDAGNAEAEGEETDRRADRDAQRDRKPQARPGSEAVVEKERGGNVGADADVERVPQGQL